MSMMPAVKWTFWQHQPTYVIWNSPVKNWYFLKNAYQGEYVKDIAQSIIDKNGDAYVRPVADVYKDVPEDVQFAAELDADGNKVVLSGDKEKHIDGLIFNSQQLIGQGYRVFLQAALKAILDDIKDDLGEFGVTFNQWFSEESLTEKN